MNRSLSVLLPVHNVQESLAAKVDDILEVLPELTDRFELVITDDASTDGTWEVARDLARRYPQIRLLRELTRRGPGCAIRESAAASQGDIVIAHNGQPGIDARAIARLWRSASSDGELEHNDGFRMLRPGAIESLRRSATAVNEIAASNSTIVTGAAPAPSRPTQVASPTDSKAPKPKYLARGKTRTRSVAPGE